MLGPTAPHTNDASKKKPISGLFNNPQFQFVPTLPAVRNDPPQDVDKSIAKQSHKV
jgi:hypothetical protein